MKKARVHNGQAGNERVEANEGLGNKCVDTFGKTRGGFYRIKVTKMVGKYVLLGENDNSDIEEIVKVKAKWFQNFFEHIQRWTPAVVVVRERLDLGRILISTSTKKSIDRVIQIMIEEKIYCIKVMEEALLCPINITKKQFYSEEGIMTKEDDGSPSSDS
ncbi:hypothetical protein RIF29_29320 [Crotalaria pallida]|uniref:Uncharacterized protein n=1 Tax=Crotalaria pallida TaxID=3830 RepID=A0AAN9HTT0_CROPI